MGQFTFDPLIAAVRRRPLIWFFMLTYLFSWWPGVFYLLDMGDIPIVGFGPFLAALVVLAATVGKQGVKNLLRGMIRWRVNIRWYLIAVFLPIAMASLATLMNVLIGAPRPTSTELGNWPEVFLVFVLLLIVPGIGGAWEEPGFRGYALPTLQGRYSSLIASQIIGVFWVLWHLPLFLIGDIEWPDILLIMAASVVLTWVFNSASRSILIVMILHAMNNSVSGEFFSPMFEGQDSVNQAWLLAAVWWTVALGLIIAFGPVLGAVREEIVPESPAAAPAG